MEWDYFFCHTVIAQNDSNGEVVVVLLAKWYRWKYILVFVVLF